MASIAALIKGSFPLKVELKEPEIIKMVDYKTLSDAELADLLKSSDNAAYTEIYNRYAKLLLVFAYKRVKDKDLAKDLVHEIFITIWSRRETFIISGKLSAYLYSAVRNKILDTIKHLDIEKKYMRSIQDFIDQNNVMADHRIREKQLADLIEKEINALPGKMKAVILLSRQDNLNYQEISEQLDLTRQSVKTYAKNALKILRVRLSSFFFL